MFGSGRRSREDQQQQADYARWFKTLTPLQQDHEIRQQRERLQKNSIQIEIFACVLIVLFLVALLVWIVD
jgi:hypothetical protein